MCVEISVCLYLLGVAAIVAQIPSIDQFRWPGYFILLHAVLLCVITLLGFREKKGDIQRAGHAITFRGIPIPFYVSSNLKCTRVCTLFGFKDTC